MLPWREPRQNDRHPIVLYYKWVYLNLNLR